MWSDIVGGVVVSIHRGSKKPAKHPRGVWLRMVSEGDQYNPVTQQRLGPQTVIESDVVRLVYTVSEHPDALPRMRVHVYERAQSIHDGEVIELGRGYTEKQIGTFDQQTIEATAYNSDVNAVTPMLDGIVEKRDMTKAELVGEINLKAAVFSEQSGKLLGRLGAISDLIDVADMDELTRIESEEITTGWD